MEPNVQNNTEPKFKIVQMTVGELAENCYLFINAQTKEGFIVDPGDEASRISVRVGHEQMKPTAILLTHGHFDHFLAADELAKRYEIPVYIHEEDASLLQDPNDNLSLPFFGIRATLKADKTFTEGDILSLCGYDFKVIHTPGHTRGSVCFYQKELGICFSGDTLFCESLGRTDFPGGNVKDIVASICKKLLLALPEDTVVYPGHNEQTTIKHEKKYNPTAPYLARYTKE